MKKKKVGKLPGMFLPGKTLRVMKLICLFIVMQTLQLSGKSFSQEVVTIKMADVSFQEIVREIERQSSVTFLYNHEYVKALNHLTLDVKKMKIEEVMSRLLKDTRLGYSFVDNTVIITMKPTSIEQTPRVRNVKGVVVDVNGNPLPGVTVMIKGTTLGVATDLNGRFSLEMVGNAPIVLVCSFVGMRKKEVKYADGKEQKIVMEEEATDLNGRFSLEMVGNAPIVLVCSFVGMRKKEVKYADGKEQKIVMEEEQAEMDEVVVTGYFNKSKESFTGSEVTVGREELKKVGALNMLQALNAFDPSIRLAESLTNGSNPNMIPDITIRGENSFDLRANADDATTNPNAPLYILDGVEVSAERIYDMDLNRIESTTILKDASATALYGSRGANGVIVITTIRPKSGEIRIALNANYNVSIPDLRDYNLMNAEEKLEYEKRAGVYTNSDYNEQMKLDELYNTRLEEVKRGVDTYWLSQPLQRSLNQRYSLNFEGGDEHFRYGIDLRYDTDKGVMKKSGRERYGVNLTFNYNIGANFFIRNDLSVDNVKATNSPYNEFYLYAQQNPYDRIYDENGKFVEKLSSGDWNPLYGANLPKRNDNSYTTIQDNFNIDWRILEAFRLQGRFSYTKEFNRQDLFKSPESLDYSTETDVTERGSYYQMKGESQRFDGNITFSYNKNFGFHVVNVGIGSNMQQSKGENSAYTGVGFINPDMVFAGAANGFKTGTRPSGSYDISRLVGFFTNVNYGYDNRYFLDFSLIIVIFWIFLFVLMVPVSLVVIQDLLLFGLLALLGMYTKKVFGMVERKIL